jgi:hypothetical protein
MLSLIFYSIINLIVVGIILLWGFMLSTDEYPVKKNEKKYFWTLVLATVIGNVVYWLQ